MRPDFNRALKAVLAHEGGYTDDGTDPGGATKFGISLRFLRAQGLDAGDLDGDGDIDQDDIRLLTVASAAGFYKKNFWDRYGYGDFIEHQVADKAFDLAVNMGPGAAHRCLQRGLRAHGLKVLEDGILGPKTRRAINSTLGDGLLRVLRSEAAGYYRSLVAQDFKFRIYLNGWLKRAYS